MDINITNFILNNFTVYDIYVYVLLLYEKKAFFLGVIVEYII